MKLKTLAVIAVLACAAITFTTPVRAQCAPTGDAIDVGVSFISQPFAYAALRPALTPAQIASLGALPAATDEIVRREHVYISTALASLIGVQPHDALGTITVDSNWRNPNPQIRVWIEEPATFSNFHRRSSGVNQFRARRSSAVFTVVGVIQDVRARVWVYEQRNTSDTDSGEYKLFAADTATATGTRVVAVQNLTDGNADGLLDNVFAQVFVTPVSSEQHTDGGQTFSTQFYCEPDAIGSYQELAVNAGDNRVAVLAPHGGDIETNTSDQLAPFETVLEAAPFNVPVNSWDVQGAWSDNQTFKRWHITATNLSESSYPGLLAMLDQPQFDPAAGRSFRHAVAFHGFSGTALDVIVGGQAPQNTKCLVVLRTQDQLAAAGLNREAAAFVIHDDAGILDVADLNNRTVTRRDLAGLSDDNIVNRLSADGGIQLEQSKALRDNATVRDAVARGAARALGEVFNGTAPANACSQL